MAVDGHRERGGPPPLREDTDALIDRLAERVLRRYWRPEDGGDDAAMLSNLVTALILEFMSETGLDEDEP